MTRLRWYCLVVGTSLWIGGAANAQQVATPDQKAAAEALFDKGLTLLKQGEYAQACTYLEQSQAVERGIGTMLYLAECYEKLGRTASAWALFREASSAAQAEGQTERAQAGATRAAQLEPQLARLAILVPPAAQVPGLEVIRNGTPIPSAVWGVAVPVDPGAQRIEARAPGYEPWAQTEMISRGAQSSVTVPQLTAAAPGSQPVAAAPAPMPPPAEPPAPSFAPAQPRAAPADSGRVQRTVAFVTGGAGVVALGVGTFFGVRAANDNSDADRLCDPGCNAAGVQFQEDAESHATLSNVFVFGGAALVAAGVVLYFTAPDGDGETAELSLAPNGTGIALRGGF